MIGDLKSIKGFQILTQAEDKNRPCVNTNKIVQSHGYVTTCNLQQLGGYLHKVNSGVEPGQLLICEPRTR